MMRQTLVPVLLLAAVALSSSNVLPILPTDRLESTAINGQQNDNILRNRYSSRNVLSNIFYTVPVSTSQNSRLLKKLVEYLNTNSDETDENLNGILNDEDNYDGEGFRKEQWHNYPRQLDRLHEYLTDYQNDNMKRSIDTYDPGSDEYNSSESKEQIIDDMFNENHLNSNEGSSIDDPVEAAINPLLILKVHLASLGNRFKHPHLTKMARQSFQTQLESEKELNDLEERLFAHEINPAVKVKREGVTPQESANLGESVPSKKKSKRLFSLWSRLQNLSHKGHELPHRRHLAFYGISEGDGGGTLTAETRAMLRPPGSPLRWG